MRKTSRQEPQAPKILFENLEEFARAEIQKRLQELLEEEVMEFLGRKHSERIPQIDTPKVYRNGYGKPRRLTMSAGTVELKRPRIRGDQELEQRFESRVIPFFVKRTKEVSELIPQLYLHGLSEGDFDLALRGLLGDEAPLSPKTVSRLKSKWQGEWDEWKRRPLTGLEVVYVWVDGVYVKAGLEKEKAALLVVLAAKADGSKEFLAIEPGHRESTESWTSVLRSLKARGLQCPRLVIGDGHLGIWGALANVYPDAQEQRCWNHRLVNVLDKLPKKHQEQAKLILKRIPYAETREEAERLKDRFQGWCANKNCFEASRLIDHDWERMVTFYNFPKEHWRHIRTTNPVESPFAGLRLRTDAAKRYKKVANATAVIWRMMMVFEKRFGPLQAPNLLKEVFQGAKYIDGLPSSEPGLSEAAA